MDDHQRAVTERVSQILAGRDVKLPSWPGIDPEGSSLAAVLTTLLNEAYAQGWAESEIDFVESYSLLEMMADDPANYAELQVLASHPPESEDRLTFRRDWLLHERATELVRITGNKPGNHSALIESIGVKASGGKPK